MLFRDNKINNNLTKNIESQYCIKYIDVQYYYIWKLVNKGKFTVKWIPSSNIQADKITKALSTKIFQKYQALLGMTIK